MNKPLVCFGIGIGMLILGMRTYFCCILTLGSPLPRRHGLRINPQPFLGLSRFLL
jgi:hypothetical protein